MAMLLDTLEDGRERRPDEIGTRPARPEFGSGAGTGWLAGYALSSEAGRDPAGTARTEERTLNREEELDSRRYPIAEDMALQCRRRFERIGWWSLGLMVLLALFGLFSQGR